MMFALAVTLPAPWKMNDAKGSEATRPESGSLVARVAR